MFSSLVCLEVSAFRMSAVYVCYHVSPCVDGVLKQRDHLQLGMQVFGPDKHLECFVLIFCCSNFFLTRGAGYLLSTALLRRLSAWRSIETNRSCHSRALGTLQF